MIDGTKRTGFPATPSQTLPTPTHTHQRSPLQNPQDAPGAVIAEATGDADRTGAASKLPRCYSMAEVAEMFGRKPRTIRHWIAVGRLKAIKVGNAVFVTQSAIDAVMGVSDEPEFSRAASDLV